MSGFLAVRSDGPLDKAVLDAIARASAHRGAPRAWTDDGIALVAFGDATLAVAEDLVIVLDGADAQALQSAWRRRKERALDHLDGDFAGAIWDRRTKELTIARDPSAGRHALLANARAAKRMLGGSSIPMLLADPGVEREIDDAWVAAYLAGAPGFATASGYHAIERLQPGHLARATGPKDTWTQRRWFEWNPPRVREKTDQAYAERLNELLHNAVRQRIRGAQRIGISLSGGLDSTSIAATVRVVAPGVELKALAVPFDEPRADERALQRLVAERVSAELIWAPLGDANPFGDGPFDMLERFGTPPVAPNQFFVDRVVEAGARANIDLALDGIDGDAAVGGNWTYLSDLLVRGRLGTLRREANAIRERHHVGRKALLKNYVLDPLRREPYKLGRMFHANEMLGVSPGVAPAVLETIDEAWQRKGIRTAHPFMDRRVMEFCLGLPREQKVRNGMTKVILRNAMQLPLPPEVTERAAKAELASSFFSGLYGTGRPLVEQGLGWAAANPSSWTRPDGVVALIEAFRAGGDGFDAYRVASIEYWRHWLDARCRSGGTV